MASHGFGTVHLETSMSKDSTKSSLRSVQSRTFASGYIKLPFTSVSCWFLKKFIGLEYEPNAYLH